jgi:hypothetical protein
MTKNYLDANLAVIAAHHHELADTGLIAFAADDLADLMVPVAPELTAERNALQKDLTAALKERAPDLLPLFGDFADAFNDLATAYEADALTRATAVACALRPPRADLADVQMDAWDAMQMLPLLGSVPDEAAVSAAVLGQERERMTDMARRLDY